MTQPNEDEDISMVLRRAARVMLGPGIVLLQEIIDLLVSRTPISHAVSHPSRR